MAYTFWTPDEIALLRAGWVNWDSAEMRVLRTYRTKHSIRSKARKIGLVPSAYEQRGFRVLPDVTPRRWTQEEIDILVQGYKERLSGAEISFLMGESRSPDGIAAKAQQLNLPRTRRSRSIYKRRAWTDEEIRMLVDVYENHGSIYRLAIKLKRSVSAVYEKASRLGLYRKDYTNRRIREPRSYTRRREQAA